MESVFNQTLKHAMECPTCGIPLEMAEGLNADNVRNYAMTCRVHGRKTPWYPTREGAQNADKILRTDADRENTRLIPRKAKARKGKK